MNANERKNVLTRRELLKVGGFAAAALAGSAAWLGRPAAAAALHDPAENARKRVLRFAHLTDIHLQPERRAPEGLTACLRHVQSQPDKPELILTGGDTIMDSMASDEARVKLQWELWQKVIKQECSLPIESCLGNHDVWGLNKEKSKTTGSEPLFGTRWAMQVFGIDSPYRSFDRAGWHFIALDGVFPEGNGYQGRLDEEQFAWLAEDLKAVPPATPVLIWSHIPVLSAAAYFGGKNEETNDWVVSRSVMHIDARRFKDLFLKHPNVKLFLSGHLHLVDRVDYLGVSYVCGGAVSGAWWKGAHYECEPGYTLVNLYDDGTFEHEYVTYGWKAAEK